MAGKRTKTENMVGKNEIPTKENTLDPKIEKLIALGKKTGEYNLQRRSRFVGERRDVG